MKNTEPGTAIRIGMMATQEITTKGEGRIRLMAHTGLSTGSMNTEAKDNRGGRIEELVTIMTNVESDQTGKEIKKIMTSQISATGMEAVFLQEMQGKNV